MAEWEMQSTDSCRLRTTTQRMRAIIKEFTEKNLVIPADILKEIKELRRVSDNSHGILKSIASIWSWGGDEMKRHKEKK